MNKAVVKSPIFYMGNKKKLINKGLINLFPDEINIFVDLFGGSGVVSMNTKANKYVINDIDPNLYELYKLFTTIDSQTIIAHIENRIDEYGLARERTKRNEFKDKKKIEQYKTAYANLRSYYNKNHNILDFYTLMFYSFSQQFRFNSKGEFNMPCGNDCFAEKNKGYIENGCAFFGSANTYITNKDFKNFPTQNLTSKDFIYLDPPYFNTTATYNESGGWTESDENDLFKICDILTSKGIKWAMSNIFENKGVANQHLIDWVKKNNYKVHHFSDFTYVSCGKGNAKTDEVLIMNY